MDLCSIAVLPYSALNSIIESSHPALYAEFESHESRRRPGLEFQDERDILLIWLSRPASGSPSSLLPVLLRQRQAGGMYNSFEPLADSESNGDSDAGDWSEEVEEDAAAASPPLKWADLESDTDTGSDSEVQGKHIAHSPVSEHQTLTQLKAWAR